MLKTPQIGVEVCENMEEESLRFPWRSLMKGDLAARERDDLELTLRVRARMVKVEGIAEDFRRALMTAPPWWPVAPVMSKALDICKWVYIMLL
jgi:hypothetical protein